MFNTATVTAQNKSSGAPRQDFGPCEAGMDAGRIVRVVGFGVQEQANRFDPNKEPATVLQVTVELPNQRITVTDKDGNETDRPRWIWTDDIAIKLYQDYNTKQIVTSDKSKLHKLLSAAFPQHTGAWTADEIKEHIPKLVGQQVGVFITHSKSKTNGKVYANLKEFSPVMRGMVVPALENETLYYNPYEHDDAVFQQLPERTRERIAGRLDGAAPQQQAPQQSAPAPQPEPVLADDFDDDVPF